MKKLVYICMSAYVLMNAQLACAQSSIKWTMATSSVSEKLQKTVEVWKKEVVQTVGSGGALPELNILIKSGEDGVFLEEEIDKWATDSDVQWARQKNWLPNKHSALILWKNKKSVGCLVYVPNEAVLEKTKDVLSYEWIVWHELSHCIWPYRQTKMMWWEKVRVLGSDKLSELQEETWADIWAVLLSKKYVALKYEKMAEALTRRSRDALAFEDFGHWTNVGIWAAWSKSDTAFEMKKQATQLTDDSTLDEDDLEWVASRWSGAKSVKPRHQTLAKDWAMLNGSVKSESLKTNELDAKR